MADPFERTCIRCFDRQANAQRPGRQSSRNDSTGPESGAIGQAAGESSRFFSCVSHDDHIHESCPCPTLTGLNRGRGCRMSAFGRPNPFPGDARLPCAALPVMCEKQEPGERPIGPPQPTPSHGASLRQRRVVGCSQPGHASPRCRRRPDHEQAADVAHVPSAALGHLARESRLAIQPVKGCLGVGDDRLDFDDEQRAEQWMEREDVDRSARAASA
jgi:hypothetical protein